MLIFAIQNGFQITEMTPKDAVAYGEQPHPQIPSPQASGLDFELKILNK